jgi:dihydroorotase
LRGIPEAAETVAVARDLALAEQTGARLHFRSLSTATGVAMLGRAKSANPKLSADVSIHQLHLTEDNVAGFDSNCHVIPPLRTGADRDALRLAVADDLIEAICSDHQPHDADAKTNPFPATAPGISGLDSLLAMALRLADEDVMGLSTVLERLTWGPARILGIAQGRLEPGRRADICIFDPNARWHLEPGTMLSCGHNTPFLGWELKGRVNWTLLDGIVVFQRIDGH